MYLNTQCQKFTIHLATAMLIFLLLFFLAKKVTKKPSLVQGVFRLQGFVICKYY